MSCRRVKKEDGVYNIVRFGSYGTEPNTWTFNINLNGLSGSAIFSDVVFVSRETIYNYIKFDFDLDSITYGIYIGTDSQNIETIYDKNGWKIKDRTILVTNYGQNQIEFKNTLLICACKKTKFFNKDNIHDNYSVETDEVVDSLIQRLSIIKGELWYQVNHGLSLFNKYKSIGILESEILMIINSHPKVKSILSYNSSVDSKKQIYYFNAEILTIYNETIAFNNAQNLYL